MTLLNASEAPNLALERPLQPERNILESRTLRIAHDDNTADDTTDHDLTALLRDGMSPVEALKALDRWHPVERSFQEATL